MRTTTVDTVPPLDLYAAWQAVNGAVYCERLQATITPAMCEENQKKSTAKWGDLRCHACGGLHNQTRPIEQKRLLLDLAWNLDEPAEAVPKSALDCTGPDDPISDFAALDQVIEEMYQDPAPADDFEDLEVDLDDEQLLALFPELAEPDEITQETELRYKEYQAKAPRRAVYHGRCQRCGGWMDNIREHQDDNVFRCFLCGWRTGPEYKQNREIYGMGGS